MNKTLKRNLVIVFSLMLLIVAVVGVIIGFKATAGEEPLKEEYVVGEKITIPSKTLNYQGTDKNAEITVYFPSGSAIKSNSVTLSESGEYTVVYSADFGSEIVSEEAKFTVCDVLYSFTGEKSSASYGKDTSIYQTNRTSLNVMLAQGETMNFNKVIDLKKLNGENFVTFYCTPINRGTPDVQGIYFVLTDIYDPNNTVTFQFKNVAYLGSSYVYLASYVTAGHGSEIPRAYTFDSADNVWRLRINDKFGVGTPLSLYGWAEDFGGTPIKNAYCQFAVDLNSKKAYLSDAVTTNAEIIDFDNPTQFDTLWKGFTTGEVKLSITAYDYTAQYFSLNIMDVAGYDFENEYLIKDTEGPEITIDSLNYDIDDLPNGYVGQSYPVFNATAYDKHDGFLDVNVRAYYGYDSDSEVELNIVNGRINTEKPGKYKITYSSTDAFGFTTEKTLKFQTVEIPTDFKITLKGSYSQNTVVGAGVGYPDYQVEGGSGEVEVTVSTDKKSEINGKLKTVTPLEVGTVKVTYTAKDITGYEVKASYDITVAKAEKPVILENVILAKYLFGGLSYKFPEVTAYDFNDAKEIKCDVFVNGTKVQDNLYTPEDKQNAIDNKDTLADSYTVKVEYKADGVTVLEKDIEVLDVRVKSGPVNNYSVNGYFVCDGYNAVANDNGVNFNATGFYDESEVVFAKPILLKNFSIGLHFNESNTQANAFVIKLVDEKDSDNIVEIKLKNDKANQKTVLCVNGEETTYSFDVGGFYDYTNFTVSVSDGFIKDSGSINYGVAELLTAEKVYIYCGFTGATESSGSFMINQIGGSALSSAVKKDQIAPVVLVCGEYGDYAKLDQEVTIYKVLAEDLLDSYITAKVSVTFTDYKGVVTKLITDASAYEEHSVKITGYGTLTVTYTVTDGAKQTRTPSYSMIVSNLVAPEIQEISVKDTYKLGKAITFDLVKAIDDTDGELEVKYFVIGREADPTLLTDRTFTPTYEGRYILRLYAIDNFSNITIVDKVFKVVK